MSLLKVDVEGSELAALCSVERWQWPLIDAVVCEVHEVAGRLPAVIALLRQAGFSVTTHRPQHQQQHEHEDEEAGEAGEAGDGGDGGGPDTVMVYATRR